MFDVRRLFQLTGLIITAVLLASCDSLTTPPAGGRVNLSLLDIGRGEANSTRFEWTVSNPEQLPVHCIFDPGDGSPVTELAGCSPEWVDHMFVPEDGFHEASVSIYADGTQVARRTRFVVTGYTDMPENVTSAMLEGVNGLRSEVRQCGSSRMPAVAPVVWNSLLEAAAQGHSDWMAEKGTLSHTGDGGSNPGARIAAEGYEFATWNENVAMGSPSVERVLASFMNSPGHCRAIMNPAVTELGAAVALSDSGDPYWTQKFARPR